MTPSQGYNHVVQDLYVFNINTIVALVTTGNTHDSSLHLMRINYETSSTIILDTLMYEADNHAEWVIILKATADYNFAGFITNALLALQSMTSLLLL